MFRLFTLIIALVCLISFPLTTYAANVRSSVSDCDSIYFLKRDVIQKRSLPSLELVKSTELSSNVVGRFITLSGGCSDPQQTILVTVKKTGNKTGDFLRSYSEDLELIAEIKIANEVEEDDDEEDEDEDE